MYDGQVKKNGKSRVNKMSNENNVVNQVSDIVTNGTVSSVSNAYNGNSNDKNPSENNIDERGSTISSKVDNPDLSYESFIPAPVPVVNICGCFSRQSW